MKSIAFSSRWLSLSLLILLTSVSAIPHNIPRLGVFDHKSLRDPSDTIPAFVWEDLETYFYNQTLDHFNYNPPSYATFKQRYVINSKYWGGANESAPIFVYLGAEAPIDGDIQFIGFLPENAPNFKALIVYIEHRFYGQSVPLGPVKENQGYFSSAQAIADYAEEVSESCYETIKQSWSVIDEVASQPNGLSILSQRFNTCSPLSDSFELKEYLDGLYSGAAQYDRPPRYPVTVVCGGIDGAPNGTDILGRIFAGVVAARVNRSCYINEHYNYSDDPYGDWDWQTCSEMVIPIGRGSNDTMFFAWPFNLTSFTEDCISSYGVPPRPHWVTTYYGGHDIKAVLQRFASNIIFSNGLRDPYSCAGVLQDISESVVAVYTVNGSHCLDILPTDKSDPQWLTDQRNTEVRIIQGWIDQYYADLLSSSKH
ncbi:lysosomal Pro-X carboxypeptidase-like isoform X2 [Camellia sinensis]|uniref:lysosomal Pro-X carboxypeptidase-like isoform X2 n=1 Tax=Camellia sinensis TaxID=4442 RepID=UPI0010362A96|nr:lysosomal Pro-X carboxypeptidase-like isoform X2 [Camellia sinensis]